MTFNELKKEKSKLSTLLKIDISFIEIFLELFDKGKLSKPELVLKSTISKINPATKYPFVYLETSKQINFFMGLNLLLGKELDDQIDKLNKEIKGAKKSDEKKNFQLKKAFWVHVRQLKPKAFFKGLAQSSRKTEEGEVKTFYFDILNSSILKKKLDKKQVPGLINALGYQPKKTLHIVFEDATIDQETESPSSKEEQSAPVQSDTEPAPVDPVAALRKAVKDAIGKDDTQLWMDLLAETENLLAIEKTEELLKIKKVIQTNFIKGSSVDLKDPNSVKVELEQIVILVENKFFSFMHNDLKLSSNFNSVNTAHQDFYHTVMSAHTMMNTLAKVGNIDFQADDNFERFKKPISLALQKASTARKLFKGLAANDTKIRKLAQNRQQDGVQETMEKLLTQTEEYTKKLLAFLN